MPLHVSTSMGDSLVVNLVVKSYVVTIRDVDTHSDLIILDLQDFEVILDMDWLSHYYAVMDYFTKNITLAMPNIPLVVWRGAVSREPMGIISYMCARKLIL